MGLPLGPHENFAPVANEQQTRGKRRLLFNFIGTIDHSRTGHGRDVMRTVVLSHAWTKP